MRVFPESALVQLEFEKVKALLLAHCRTEYAKEKAAQLRIHTKKEFIQLELQQSYEMKLLLEQSQYFPTDYVLNLSRELKLLSIPGAVLSEDQLVNIRKLAENAKSIFHWFDAERQTAYPALSNVIEGSYYEKVILELINDVLDESGIVKDDASEALGSIRMNLYRKRNELRREFEKVLKKLQKQGYVADIEKSFLNGRRVVALFAEQKRQVKGILHGESETRRTVFVEPGRNH